MIPVDLPERDAAQRHAHLDKFRRQLAEAMFLQGCVVMGGIGGPVFRIGAYAGEAGFRAIEELSHRLGGDRHLLLVHGAGQQLVDRGHDGVDIRMRHECPQLSYIRHDRAARRLAVWAGDEKSKNNPNFYALFCAIELVWKSVTAAISSDEGRASKTPCRVVVSAPATRLPRRSVSAWPRACRWPRRYAMPPPPAR